MQAREEIKVSWAEDSLASSGYKIQGQPKIVRTMLWSRVTSFETSKGRVYLKSMALPFSKEPILLQFLADHGVKNITKVIAVNEQLSCFLMKDAGEPLRNLLKENFKIDLLINALKTCASIQIKCIDYVDQLCGLGINDWRLEKLPFLYQDLVQKEEMLKADGLTLSEIKILYQSAPKMHALCRKLSEYGIPETLEHGDFQDNNMLISRDSLTLSDWGDASISHPFFSLSSALNSSKRNHHFQDDDPRYISAQNAYLDQWREYGTETELLEAFKLAQTIRHFVFALNLSRVKSLPHIDNVPKLDGYLANSLRDFIKSIS